MHLNRAQIGTWFTSRDSSQFIILSHLFFNDNMSDIENKHLTISES